MTSETDFDAFMETRRAAALAYVNGDGAPVEALTTDTDPATFFGPGGGAVEGADAVLVAFRGGASSFEPGSKNRLEVLQSASGDLAFWTGRQISTVRIKGQPDPVAMSLRITEVFRREGGAWKLIHRHADTLAEPQQRPA